MATRPMSSARSGFRMGPRSLAQKESRNICPSAVPGGAHGPLSVGLLNLLPFVRGTAFRALGQQEVAVELRVGLVLAVNDDVADALLLAEFVEQVRNAL